MKSLCLSECSARAAIATKNISPEFVMIIAGGFPVREKKTRSPASLDDVLTLRSNIKISSVEGIGIAPHVIGHNLILPCSMEAYLMESPDQRPPGHIKIEVSDV